jgi:deazaflavin-dependent oxidoreductase (nitroreductase family)
MIRANEKLRLKLERLFMVFAYRLFGGLMGDRYQILLLTTTGRKTHRKRTVPVVYMRVRENFVLTGSNIGSDDHPAWYLNLKNNPQAHIQIGKTKLNVLATEADQEEREPLWQDWIKEKPGYADFQAKTTRRFPMVILKPV